MLWLPKSKAKEIPYNNILLFINNRSNYLLLYLLGFSSNKLRRKKKEQKRTKNKWDIRRDRIFPKKKLFEFDDGSD